MNTHKHFMFPIAKVLVFLTFIVLYISAQRSDDRRRIREDERELESERPREMESDRQREIESDRQREREGRTSEDKYYIIIKHPVTGFVLDASEEEVKLQQYNQTDEAQFWKLEATVDGKFIILNKGKNNQALDVKNGVAMGAIVITYAKHGQENQQFYINSDGSIVSTVNKLAVEIRGNSSSVGSGLVVNSKNNGPSQKFSVEIVQFA